MNEKTGHEFECLDCGESFIVPRPRRDGGPEAEECPYCKSINTVEFDL